MKIISVIVLGILGCSGLYADVETVSGTYTDLQSMPGAGITVPGFDPSVGTLNSVSISWTASLSWDGWWADIFDPNGTQLQVDLSDRAFGTIFGISDSSPTFEVSTTLTQPFRCTGPV